MNANKTHKTCRTCVHRERWALNAYSDKVVQCCNLQRSRRSNSGYKTIKVTDPACPAYRQAGDSQEDYLDEKIRSVGDKFTGEAGIGDVDDYIRNMRGEL